MMPTRYWDLENALAGTVKTGVPLITLDGNILGPAGGTDDVGSYYLVPKLAMILGLSIRRSIDLFYTSLLGLGFLVGSAGFLRLFSTWRVRAIALTTMSLLTLIAYRVGDVYIFYFATAVISVPWMLLLARRAKIDFWFAPFLFLIGIFFGVADWVRSHSGTAALLFVGCLIFYLSTTWRSKLVLLACLACGLTLPQLFFSRLVKQRDAFFAVRCPEYAGLASQHPLWHSVYIGLGYLKNEYGIRYDDNVAYDKVESIAMGTVFVSPRYESILKEQVILLAHQHPWFVIATLAAKAGVVLLILIFSANFGLIATALHPKPWLVESAFWLAMAFNSLFGILVYPLPQYLLGLVSFAALYGIASWGFALEMASSSALRRTSPALANRLPASEAKQTPQGTVLVPRH